MESNAFSALNIHETNELVKMLQCLGLVCVYVAVCCSVTQCVTHELAQGCVLGCVRTLFFKSALQCVLQCVAMWYSVLQCVAVCCCVWQCVAVCVPQ